MELAAYRSVLVPLLGAVLAGCAPWPHFVTVVPEVNGQVVQSGKALSNATILTKAGVSGTPCEASTIVTKTRDDGSFTIASQSQFRLFVVPLVDPLTVNSWELCIEHQGHALIGLRSWNSQAWTDSIVLSCDVDQRFPQKGLIGTDMDGACRLVTVGNIAGIKLSVPNDYVLYGVHYKGDATRNSSHHAPPRSFASEIQEFSLLLHLPTLQPGQNEQVWPSYLEFRQPVRHRPGGRSFSVSFSSDSYAANGGQLQAVLDRYMKGYMKDDSQGGPFISQDGEVYGLKHALSKHQENERSRKHSITQSDQLLYDPTTWGTVITCGTYRRNEPPFDLLSDCEHQFVVPELKVVASIHYEKADLSHWQEIENVIKQITHSVVVE